MKNCPLASPCSEPGEKGKDQSSKGEWKGEKGGNAKRHAHIFVQGNYESVRVIVSQS